MLCFYYRSKKLKILTTLGIGDIADNASGLRRMTAHMCASKKMKRVCMKYIYNITIESLHLFPIKIKLQDIFILLFF